MQGKYHRADSGLASIVKMAASMPRWQAIGSVLIVILVGTMLLYALKGSHEVILGYYVVILTVLVWLTYEYARSIEAMARRSIGLAKAGERETLRSKTKRITREGIILQELLDELRNAQGSGRPPFDLSAWEQNSEDFDGVKELADLEKHTVASCYQRLRRQNMEESRWEKLESKLEGLVNSDERRRTTLLLRAMEEENRCAVKSAITVLEDYLGK